jgi:FK506-binding nuclear protein
VVKISADQHPQDNLPFDDDSLEDEEGYDLREVSSDVEVNPDELGSDDERSLLITISASPP